MKITYECESCGFRSQNKEEVERCEAQGTKNKFSVGQEVEYALDKEKKQWGRVKVYSVFFKERTHEISYSIKPYNEIYSPSAPGLALQCVGRLAKEDELRPVSVEQKEYELTKDITFPILADGGSSYHQKLDEIIEGFIEKGFGDEISGRITFKGEHDYNQGVASLIHITVQAEYDSNDDLRAIIEQIDKALRTKHSRVLRFT